MKKEDLSFLLPSLKGNKEEISGVFLNSKKVTKCSLFIALKGKIALEEIKEASNAILVLDFNLDSVISDHLPTSKDARTNIFLQKIKKTNSKYPRNYGQIKKHPL